MTLKSTTFRKSIRLKPDADTILSEEGTLKVDSGDNKLKAYLGAALRALVSEDQSQTLTNKTIVVANNTITTAASGNLAATELNAALSELQSDIDTRATSSALTTHTGASSGVHGVVGSVVGTSDSQVLTNKTIDADLNTITNIENADIKSGAAIARNKLASGTANRLAVNDGSGVLSDAAAITAARALISDANGIPTQSAVTSTELGYVAGVTSAIQTQLGTKADGAASSTDEAIARFDSTTGKILQNSVVTISDAGVMSGSTQLNVDNLRLDGNDISSTNTNGNIDITPNGTGIIDLNKDSRFFQDVAFQITTDSTTTGADATLVDPATKIIRLTNASLTSVAMIPAGSQGQQITLINHTGASVTIQNNLGATAANRILTGQKSSISLSDEASLILEYDSTESRWMVIGGTGAGSGAADVNALLIQTFDKSGLSDFTQTGLDITILNPLNGAQSAALTHQGAINQSFKQTIAVDRKFRSKAMILSLVARSTATSGNLTIQVQDETNAASLLNSSQIQSNSSPFTADMNGTTTLSNISAANIILLAVGEGVSGPNIPTGAVITSVGTTSIVISASATATASAVSLRASDLPQRRSFSFTIPASCASLSYTVTALPEANSPRSVVDDVVIELSETANLETSVVVPIQTDWTSYVPNFTGFGTVTNINFQSRRVGSSIEIRGRATAGTVVASEARVTFPTGVTVGHSTSGNRYMLGIWGRTGTATGHGGFILGATNDTYMIFSQGGTFGSVSLSPDNASNAGDMVNNGESFTVNATFQVQGWAATETKVIPLTQSGLVTKSDSAIFLDTSNGFGSTNTKIRRFTSLRSYIGSDVSYSDSATLGASFTIVTSGIYDISYGDNFGVAGQLAISKNASGTTNSSSLEGTGQLLSYATTDASGRTAVVTFSGYLVAGDIIRPHSDGAAGGTAARATFSISKQSSLKQVSVSSDQKIEIPTSELRFEGASALGAVATAIVRFNTLARIRGDAFSVVNDANSGTAITMLKAGRISVDCGLYITTGGSDFYITRNQVTLTSTPNSLSDTPVVMAGTTSSSSFRDSLSATFTVAVGDVIRVSSAAAPSNTSSNVLSLSFQEQQVAVSVSNTLPQFSQSDSSVRVDTANGYGSTATRIRRFSNVRDNIGSDITYTDSGTNGASFTVNTAGIYNISYSDNFNSASRFGISKNASSLTTDINSITASERLAIEWATGSGQDACVSWQGSLTSGDIIRPHGDAAASSDVTRTTFTISKVGKPNVTGVNVTPFVNLAFDTGSIGEIKAFAGNVDSNAFLACNGSAVSRTSYADLFRAIGTSHGQGDGSTTFNLPDYRGRFLRGVAGGSANDPDRASRTAMTTGGNTGDNVGSVQADIVGQHNHNLRGDPGTALPAGSGQSPPRITQAYNSTHTTDTTGPSGIGNETRPKNAYVNYGIRFKAANEAIISPTETFSTDTASLTYFGSGSYTLSTLQNAPVGSYITFTYAISTNTRTQTTTAPTQTTADMNSNGIQIFTRAYNAASTAAQPAAIAIQIGKGLKGVSRNLYKNIGKVTSGQLDTAYYSTTVQQGLRYNSYNEVTGILYLDAAQTIDTSITSNSFIYEDLSNQTSGYIVINASKNPALTGINIPPQVFASYTTNAGQSIPNGIETIVDFEDRVIDTHNAVTTGASWKFTAPMDGIYTVSAVGTYASASFGVDLSLSTIIFKNGTSIAYGRGRKGNTSTVIYPSPTLVHTIKLNAGDYIDIRFGQDSGGARTLRPSGEENYVTIIKEN